MDRRLIPNLRFLRARTQNHSFDARIIANVFVVFASAVDHETWQINREECNWLF